MSPLNITVLVPIPGMDADGLWHLAVVSYPANVMNTACRRALKMVASTREDNPNIDRLSRCAECFSERRAA